MLSRVELLEKRRKYTEFLDACSSPYINAEMWYRSGGLEKTAHAREMVEEIDKELKSLEEK